VVAGMRTGSARGTAGTLLPLPDASAWSRPLHLATQGSVVWPALVGLYLVASLALLAPWPFGAHPAWAYNWEDYAAWRWASYWEAPAGPNLAILAPTDGLMTDSGRGPLTGLPISIGVALFGFGIEAMRLPVALVAAAAPPLLWLIGRRLVGAGPATFAALLLALSPPFLVYGRTATLVGVSLVPLLVTALALARVLDPSADSRWRWQREGLLVVSLLLGIDAYAPVRLLWPLTVGLLGLHTLWHRARRGVLLKTLVLGLLAVPVALMGLAQVTAPDPDPLAAVGRYFNARGEQLMAMGSDPSEAGQYVRDPGATVLPVQEAERRLVEQNAADLARLILDRDTLPIPTDYWNERGRFWPWFLVPFGLVGSAVALWQGRQGGPGAAPRLLALGLGLGLALPLLLTSRVHVGRLLPVLPFALLLAASGVWLGVGWLASRISRFHRGSEALRGWLAPLLAVLLLMAVVATTQAEMTTPIAPTRAARTAATLAAWQHAAREREGAILVEDPALGDEIECVHAAAYRLELDGAYRFIDLQEDVPALFADDRPFLYWHGALDALREGAIPQPCQSLWFVGPEIARDFFAAWRAAGCMGAPDSVILP
jgi:hypothetical protein